jgi:hypothetical protein
MYTRRIGPSICCRIAILAIVPTTACVSGKVGAVDRCAGQSCSGHGTCSAADTAPACACDDTYHRDSKDPLACVADSLCVDADHDSFGTGCAAGDDCDDGDPTVHQMLTGYVDDDGDGYGHGAAIPICSGATLPAGYAAVDGDCDESSTAIPGTTPCPAVKGLAWIAPTTNADGTPLLDLAGYKLHFGTSSHAYTDAEDIGMAACAPVAGVGVECTFDPTNLTAGTTYYVAVTAYDHEVPPNESAYSNEVSLTP